MAQLRNTSIDDTGNLSLPSGTTAERPASPQQGMIRYNTTLNDTEYYDGTAWRSIADTGVEATGGTIIDTEIGGVAYRIHQFIATGNSTFTVTKGGEVEYLIVAGGGGGGSGFGNGAGSGGGGAGGLLTGTTTVTPQAYTITVGSGGAGGSANLGLNQLGQNGSNGGNSAFGTIATAVGGGGGARPVTGVNGLSGGSGGGAGRAASGGAAQTGQGNVGGNNTEGSPYRGGGGGGAGSAGTEGRLAGGNGGQGLLLSIIGSATFYAGGGGGGTYDSSIAGIGGLGGGGSGAINTPSLAGFNGFINSGGGGGGGSSGSPGGVGGAGGSGIVVVRYRRNSSTAISPNIQTKSRLPYSGYRNIENIFVSRSGLLTYVDAGNRTSYPGSGTVWTDLSGNGFNGDFIDGPFFVNETEGLIRFDGLNDRIHFSNPSNRWAWAPNGVVGNFNRTLSFEMWVRSTDTDGMYFSRPWNGSGQYNYWLTVDGWYKTAGSTGNNQSFSTLATGRWEYVCAIVTETQTAVYRNGVINAPFTNHGVSGAVPSAGNGGESLLLMSLYPYGGGWGGNVGFSIQGDVAVFRAYNRILSATEVADHYAAERWRFGV
jgi:hypothetical protein